MVINIKQFVRFLARADFKERAGISLTFPNAKTAPHVTFAPTLPSRLEPKAAATPVLRPSNLRLHHIALHRLHPFIALIHPTYLEPHKNDNNWSTRRGRKATADTISTRMFSPCTVTGGGTASGVGGKCCGDDCSVPAPRRRLWGRTHFWRMFRGWLDRCCHNRLYRIDGR